MRMFRFIGRSKDYNWDNYPRHGCIYPGNLIGTCEKDGFKSDPLQEWAHERPTEWVELQQTDVDPSFFEIDNGEITKIPNQDQPASSMTKFEKCVIDIIGNIYSNINIKTQTPTYKEISQIAINQAKETFKQLSECQE